jgi:hypothetical protein
LIFSQSNLVFHQLLIIKQLSSLFKDKEVLKDKAKRIKEIILKNSFIATTDNSATAKFTITKTQAEA